MSLDDRTMRLRPLVLPLIVVLSVCAATGGASAQQSGVERLPADVLDVAPPSTRVHGVPGAMSVSPRACRAVSAAGTRRRIVDVAVQEWAFFGFRIAAAADVEDGDEAGREGVTTGDPGSGGRRGRRSRLSPTEAARVASSIAGYWTVTPEGAWIVARQNDRWNAEGVAARWNAPWSAAFISWVMCEAGLGSTAQFQRAIAHHTYIDQALRARDGRASEAGFVAYDPGETAIVPGDLLCSSRRPVYRTIADRRRQMGVGARSHCDVVVKVDQPQRRIYAIGGNVRGVVSLKSLPAVLESGGVLRPDAADRERPIFAHLKLRAAPIDANALDTSPAIEASRCAVGSTTRAARAAAPLAAAGISAARC